MFKRLRFSLFTQIEEQCRLCNQLLDDWKRFCQQHTYLTMRHRAFFDTALASSGTGILLRWFHRWLIDDVHRRLLDGYEKKRAWLQQEIRTHPQRFLEERLALCTPLFERGHERLDADQRLAVIRDDQHNLVVAGAGSGKTSVLVARIAYLLQRPDAVKPERILALAYNKSAAEEIKDRLQAQFQVKEELASVNVETFHGFGLRLLKEHGIQTSSVQKTEALLEKGWSDWIHTDRSIQTLFVQYLNEHMQDVAGEADFATKEDYYDYMRHQRYRTLNGIDVKSLAEREIANFFVTHGIQFVYERPVTWLGEKVRYRPDFYLPDQDVYLEHWGIDKDGHTAPWIDEDKYYRSMQWKRQMFREHNKVLIESWHYEYQANQLLELLQRRLALVAPSLTFDPLPYEELVEQVYAYEHSQMQQIKRLLVTWIGDAKSQLLSPMEIRHRLSALPKHNRVRVFGELAVRVYERYEHMLQEHRWLDFHDLINQTITLLEQHPQQALDRYDHILVDEFQDISFTRLRLLRCFVNGHSCTKLFCVGDDWQSIYRFSGSDVGLFVHFDRFFPEPTVTILPTNYRSTQTIVHASSHLIAYNREQRPKHIRAFRSEEELILLYTYRGTDAGFGKAQTHHVFQEVTRLLNQGVSSEEILVISRFHRPLQDFERLLQEKRVKSKVRCLTVHQSKGSQARYVFVLSVISGLFGFPSEMQDNTVLNLLRPSQQPTQLFEEERRLCYVALTRSQQYLFLYTRERVQSLFLSELRPFLTPVLLSDPDTNKWSA